MSKTVRMARTIKRALREPLSARTWRELVYSLLSAPFALLGLAAVLATCLLGILSAGVILLPLLPLLLAVDRALAAAYRGMARSLLGLEVEVPPRPPRGHGAGGWLARNLVDVSSWRAVGYLAIRFPLGLVQFLLGFGWWLYSLLFLLYPLMWRLQADTATHKGGGDPGLGIAGFRFDTWARSLILVAFGVLALLVWPWVQRLPLLLDRWLMVRLLGPSASQRRLVLLEETRELAITEAAATLRRIERDLHDGAQARIIALGMRLGRAESRLLKGDAEKAVELIAEARAETREIVQELRELVRGIHPPALDSGLEAALTTLAARAPLPTTVRVAVGERPQAAVETMLYFAAAELLANAAKHADAQQAAIAVLESDGRLRLLVTDDGRGGATLAGAGSGLRGLAERVRVADGLLTVDSPPGGPTTVTVELERR
ncbi:sensor histidine kinase [Streptacidiphilus jiangxiensis]|uniref:histidine kinase n=1 Tax=Streptacidiphilus jiangxiensis TaxID=235985 RepID=A0A1H7VJW9_STRJI|nr:sensor domain-containing protein [Streptacidiphilus jiangxiensis]SEM09117.1 Signal transduction histidine kinase [Streptacidiphilus jiangxiensis]